MVPFFLTWGFHTPPACFFFSFLGFPLWQRFAILQIFLRTIFARTTTKSLKTLPAPPPFEKITTNSSKIKNNQVFYIFFYVILSSDFILYFFLRDFVKWSEDRFFRSFGCPQVSWWFLARTWCPWCVVWSAWWICWRKRMHRPEMLRQHATEVQGSLGEEVLGDTQKHRLWFWLWDFWCVCFCFEAGNKMDPQGEMMFASGPRSVK